jgi:hypothetical protein
VTYVTVIQLFCVGDAVFIHTFCTPLGNEHDRSRFIAVNPVPSSSASRSKPPPAYLWLLPRIGKSIECPEGDRLRPTRLAGLARNNG